VCHILAHDPLPATKRPAACSQNSPWQFCPGSCDARRWSARQGQTPDCFCIWWTIATGQVLNQGDFVEIAFQAQSGPVHGMGEMLSPMPSTRDGLLQPFRFVALEDEHHRALSMTVESGSDRSFQGIRSRQWSAPKSI
jgi:hypothetical protein